MFLRSLLLFVFCSYVFVFCSWHSILRFFTVHSLFTRAAQPRHEHRGMGYRVSVFSHSLITRAFARVRSHQKLRPGSGTASKVVKYFAGMP